MLSDFPLPPWLLWTAGALAAAALAAAALAFLRQRAGQSEPEIPLTIQPLSGARSKSGPATSMPGGKPFLPPPAPIAAAPTDPNAEHRATFRRIGNAVLIQIADADSQRKPILAWVIDRSRSGLRLASERDLPVGTLFTVRPMNAPPSIPWTPVEVRHCTKADGFWEAGCRFLEPPPVQVLMQFG
jgi:hypothetical protein